jgi:hypothetical protein
VAYEVVEGYKLQRALQIELVTVRKLGQSSVEAVVGWSVVRVLACHDSVWFSDDLRIKP